MARRGSFPIRALVLDRETDEAQELKCYLRITRRWSAVFRPLANPDEPSAVMRPEDGESLLDGNDVTAEFEGREVDLTLLNPFRVEGESPKWVPRGYEEMRGED